MWKKLKFDTITFHQYQARKRKESYKQKRCVEIFRNCLQDFKLDVNEWIEFKNQLIHFSNWDLISSTHTQHTLHKIELYQNRRQPKNGTQIYTTMWER